MISLELNPSDHTAVLRGLTAQSIGAASNESINSLISSITALTARVAALEQAITSLSQNQTYTLTIEPESTNENP